jgi:hypothetical protein
MVGGPRRARSCQSDCDCLPCREAQIAAIGQRRLVAYRAAHGFLTSVGQSAFNIDPVSASKICTPNDRLFAPAGTPRDVLKKIRTAMEHALNATTVRSLLEQQDFNVVPTSSLEEAKSWLAGEVDNWRNLTAELRSKSRTRGGVFRSTEYARDERLFHARI